MLVLEPDVEGSIRPGVRRRSRKARQGYQQECDEPDHIPDFPGALNRRHRPDCRGRLSAGDTGDNVSVTKFDLIIFDCDGVLVDSEPILNRAHAEILGELGFGITPQELIARFCGTPDAEMLATIQQELGATSSLRL
jgi:hypothetical protein